jgi:predicted dinucleotide-binding enzyme
MFYSGPTQGAQIVEALIEAVGMRPVHVGSGVAAADVLDGITRLWFTLALQQGRGRHLAFRTLS